MVDPRLRDVADRAGVSMATASYVLRNSPGARISPQTRTRVRLAADEIGYRGRAPHRLSGVVVLMVPEHTERVAPGLVDAVTEHAWAKGLATVLLPRTAAGSDAAMALRDEGLRTVGIIDVEHEEGAVPGTARAEVRDPGAGGAGDRQTARVTGSRDWDPTVVVDLANRSPATVEDRALVVPDDRQAARQVADALRRAGHDHVALVADDRHPHLLALWRDGVAEVLRRQPPVIQPSPGSATGVSPPLRQALHDCGWPTAMICLAEPCAGLADEVAAEELRSSADDVAVVVRGGAPDLARRGTFLHVPLPVVELARAALRALDASGAVPGAPTRTAGVTRVRFAADSVPHVPLRRASHAHLRTVGTPATAG